MAMASRAMAYAIDALSKNALADIVVDRIRAEMGEDATDQQVAETIERWSHPVAVVRGEKSPGIVTRLNKIANSDAAYKLRNGIN